MFCRHIFGNISGGFRGISRFFGNFAGPRPREISEALIFLFDILKITKLMKEFDKGHSGYFLGDLVL